MRKVDLKPGDRVNLIVEYRGKATVNGKFTEDCYVVTARATDLKMSRGIDLMVHKSALLKSPKRRNH